MSSFDGMSKEARKARVQEIGQLYEEMMNLKCSRINQIQRATEQIDKEIDRQVLQRAALINDVFWTYEVCGLYFHLFTTKAIAESFMLGVLKQLNVCLTYKNMHEKMRVIKIVQCHYSDTYFKGEPCYDMYVKFPYLCQLDKDPSCTIADRCWGGRHYIPDDGYC